jgi:hypothetical protein
MTLKLYNAKIEMTGEHLWAKFQDWQKEICIKYTPKFPKDLSSLQSGHQIRDAYKMVVLDRFKEEYVS